MDKVRVALVGAGGISQVYRIPSLKKMEDVELVALCDIDEAKVSFIADKFNIERVYYDVQNLLRREELDGIFICTPNNFHYPMALAALDQGVTTMVEKPLALNAEQATRLGRKATNKNVKLVVGMNYRFREDAILLKDFLEKNELGKPFYVKMGWLRAWDRTVERNWLSDVKISGGGVLMDMGIQLIDLALWLLGKPKVKSVRTYCYNLFMNAEVEDSALVVIETVDGIAITVEVAWRLHLQKDMNYAHVFGKKGSAFMNPLRIFKELHGNLVNVTPIYDISNIDIYKHAFEKEIRNFINVIKGESQPFTTVDDGIYIMKVMDAVYKSADQGMQIELES